MTRVPMRPMTVGEVLDRSFQVLRRGFKPLFLTALIGTVPLLLLYLVAGLPFGTFTPADPTAPAGGVIGLAVLLMLVTLVCYALVWGALAWQVDRLAQGAAPSVADGVKVGAKSMLRLIGAGIVLYALLLIPIILVGVGAAVLIPAAADGSGVGMFVAVAFLGMLIVAIWMMIRWVPLAFITLPQVVIERTGPIASVKRARELAKGGRLRLLVVAILAWLLVALPYFGLPLVLGMGSAMWDPAAAGTYSTGQFYLYQLLAFGIGAITTPFLAASMVFAYYDRRARRDAYDVDLAAAPAVI